MDSRKGVDSFFGSFIKVLIIEYDASDLQIFQFN